MNKCDFPLNCFNAVLWTCWTILRFCNLDRGHFPCLDECRKYISSSGENNQYFSRVRSTSENADIFTARDEMYLVLPEKKSIFFFLLYSEIQKAQPYFFPGRFLSDCFFQCVHWV